MADQSARECAESKERTDGKFTPWGNSEAEEHLSISGSGAEQWARVPNKAGGRVVALTGWESAVEADLEELAEGNSSPPTDRAGRGNS